MINAKEQRIAWENGRHVAWGGQRRYHVVLAPWTYPEPDWWMLAGGRATVCRSGRWIKTWPEGSGTGMSQWPWDSLRLKTSRRGRAGLGRKRQWLRSVEPTLTSVLRGLYLLSLFLLLFLWLMLIHSLHPSLNSTSLGWGGGLLFPRLAWDPPPRLA